MCDKNQNDYGNNGPPSIGRPAESAPAPYDVSYDGHIYPPVANRESAEPHDLRRKDPYTGYQGGNQGADYRHEQPSQTFGYEGQNSQYRKNKYQGYEGFSQPENGQYSRSQTDPGGYKRPNALREGYRYTPGSGWQRGGSSFHGRGYEWNFNDYDELDKRKREGGKKGSGILIFVVCLFSVVVVSIVGVTGYSMLSGIAGSMDGGESEVSSALLPESRQDSPAAVSSSESVQLELSSRPPSSETAVVGNRLTIPQIAKQVTPSVVGISAFQGSRYYDPVSMGSGIIMTSEGYIITNAHVVIGATRFKVQLSDDRPFDATLIGADASTDLAILKIEAEGLVAASFGDSNGIEVGEMVVAIGNPSGSELAGSVTSGIVSAVNRQVTTGSYSFKYIQTDAAINPGNSGGALVNEYGQVIGINSSKIVATGYEGIGFAIPVADAKPILDDIIANGRVTGRVMLGVTCAPVSDVDAKNFGVPPGLEIQDISPDSDIANYDVQGGDILTHIDGTPVYSHADVQAVLKDRKAGDEVILSLFRRVTAVRDIEFEVKVKLIEN